MRLLLLISLPIYGLDQVTKWWIIHHLEEPIAVIPGLFNIVYVTNTGAAFGMLKNNNIFFISVSLIALAVLSWLFIKKAFADNWARMGGVLLIPGILGNLTDRLLHKHVIDFLDFHIGENHWPSFNVADSAICVAVGCFLISSFIEWRRSKIKPATDQ